MEQHHDIGFGASLEQSKGRLINKDGTFNIIRKGSVNWDWYQYLINISNLQFILFTFTFFITLNCLFALGFLALGIDGLSGVPEGSILSDFLYAFFFSVQTFTTVGYGEMSPISIPVNLLASLCALIGILGAALVTGLFFARFVRPKSHIAFSEKAIIAPYQGYPSFQCRLVNTRSHKIVNLHARVVLSWVEKDDIGIDRRKFVELKLRREKIMLFPLNWNLVHRIDEESPLYKKSYEDLKKVDAEFLIMVAAYDESYNQNIHADVSYTCDELVNNAVFKTMYRNNKEGNMTELYLDELDIIEKI